MRSMRLSWKAWLPVMLLLGAMGVFAQDERARPPAQPVAGPGGSQYAHAAVTRGRHGDGAGEYWLMEPAEPRPEKAPVIVFLHGWGGLHPAIYGEWIEHLTRKGHIVIFPRYQADLRTPVAEFTPTMLAAVAAALQELETGDHVKPDREQCAAVGHSMGGVLAANLAALAAEHQLPVMRAVMSVQPGKTQAIPRRIAVELADLSRIPKDTLLLAVAGDADVIARDHDARRVYRESTAIPAENKDYVIVHTDEHGEPALRADHFSPTSPKRDWFDGAPEEEAAAGDTAGEAGLEERQGRRGALDALDYYAYWKLSTALCDAAFAARNRQYALGNTPEQRDMGAWSDGVKIAELTVTDEP